jgi:hypothetical protein
MPPMESTAKPLGCCHEAAATFNISHLSVRIERLKPLPQVYLTLDEK